MFANKSFIKKLLAFNLLLVLLIGCQSQNPLLQKNSYSPNDNPDQLADLPENNSAQKSEEPFSLAKQVEDFRLRYNLKNAFDKLVDNRGNGFTDLYGTRNFRVVLHGIYYRGGANNKFHNQDPRHNENPLPNDGLQNLCEDGFTHSLYLYDTNFQTAPTKTNCITRHNQSQSLEYEQLSAFKTANIEPFLKIIFEHIKGVRSGPVYAHCWNGWHASGQMAALTLKQFCGWTSNDAVTYWDKNTDGNNKEPNYEKIRDRIRKFVPLKQLQISAEEQKLICP